MQSWTHSQPSEPFGYLVELCCCTKIELQATESTTNKLSRASITSSVFPSCDLYYYIRIGPSPWESSAKATSRFVAKASRTSSQSSSISAQPDGHYRLRCPPISILITPSHTHRNARPPTPTSPRRTNLAPKLPPHHTTLLPRLPHLYPPNHPIPPNHHR